MFDLQATLDDFAELRAICVDFWRSVPADAWDARTGKEKGEIRIPGIDGAWKWMAMVDDVLYVMAGKEAAGVELDCLDVGGGFPGSYANMEAPPLEDYMAAIRTAQRLLDPERHLQRIAAEEEDRRRNGD